MSIFDKNIVTNNDKIVLKEYDFLTDPFTHISYLQEKDHGWYPQKIFIGGEMVWREYVDYSMNDAAKISRIYISKESFLSYIQESSLIEKLIFKGRIWYRKQSFEDLFDAYNDCIFELYIKLRH